jgi:ferredoxin-NADP reductase
MIGAGISDADARTIISYLASQNEPKGPEASVKMEVARALVDQRCGRCHSLDRVYKAVEASADWREIVTRMVGYAAGSAGALQPGEDEKIIGYLSATQTPQAVAQRRAKADAAASAGQSLIAQSAPAAPALPAGPSRYDRKTIGFVSLVCLAAVALVIRRPRTRSAPPAAAAPPMKGLFAVPPRAPASPFLLQLVQITKQTPDSATLRFAVTGERKLDARPGQFLTFSFLFDGKKEIRCYSICSSPARTGYIEITPKRVENGCVSVFLNDRAAIGMTVEATGPSGRLYLTSENKKIVLVAAGSGITPMIAMLRYLDDLCLDTHATLLYSVRTRDDIMFRQEFAELSARLKHFQYDVLLSKPDADWPGARGRISREFIAKNITDFKGSMFFLCGPPPFMEAVRRILTDLGVPPERVQQETFGGAGAEPKAALPRTAETGFTIEFASSGKTAAVNEGQSILEAAAEAGVDIPSACRQGLCGTCKTRLLSGSVQMTAEQGLDPDSKARGFVLTCVGHAGGNVKLDA